MSARDELMEILHQTATADRVKDAALARTPVVMAKVEAAADAILSKFIIIDRGELPDVWKSTNENGICAATAQEFHQPELYFHPADGDQPGTWNRQIAYANLAVALAVEAKLSEESEALDTEAHHLYEAACEAVGVRPVAVEWVQVKSKYVAIARKARELHGAS